MLTSSYLWTAPAPGRPETSLWNQASIGRSQPCSLARLAPDWWKYNVNTINIAMETELPLVVPSGVVLRRSLLIGGNTTTILLILKHCHGNRASIGRFQPCSPEMHAPDHVDGGGTEQWQFWFQYLKSQFYHDNLFLLLVIWQHRSRILATNYWRRDGWTDPCPWYTHKSNGWHLESL